MSSPPTSGAPNRRLDIQGLRAISVLVVIAFHAGLSVPGGFIGVDTFFVISGFVITGMLQREWLKQGRIRFARFYIRRFKRLVPALAVLVAATMVLASLVLSPLGSQQVASKTAAGAMLFSANWAIAKSTGDYFDAPAESNPLLNTWSLSVEEQFYFVFPAILALGWLLLRSARFRFAPVVLVGMVTAGSFLAASLHAAGLLGNGRGEFWFGFYGPVNRAWEFGVGALLALAPLAVKGGSRRLASLLGVAGLALLALSLFVITSTTTFPGPWALLPVAATGLLLVAGGIPGSVTNPLLASRPMVKIGDWSYSLYLWHWPPIVFAKVLWPQYEWAPLVAALLSVLPALASYRWVEDPLRRLEVSSRARGVAVAVGVVAPSLLVASSIGWAATHYWTPRYESGQIPIAHQGDIGHVEFHSYVRDHNFTCTPREIRDQSLNWEGILRCQQSKPDPNIDLVLIGDSHAEHLFLGLADSLPDANVAYYIVDGLPVKSNPQFARILDVVTASPSISTVVINAYWGGRGVPEAELTETLTLVSRSGKAVFVPDDTPDFPFEPFSCKYRRGLVLPPKCSQPADAFRARYDAYLPVLRRVVGQVPNTRMLSTAQYFCDEDTCEMTIDGRLMFRDLSHLNINGSRFLARQILNDTPAFAADLRSLR